MVPSWENLQNKVKTHARDYDCHQKSVGQEHEWVVHCFRLVVFLDIGEEGSVFQVEVSVFHKRFILDDKV